LLLLLLLLLLPPLPPSDHPVGDREGDREYERDRSLLEFFFELMRSPNAL